MNNTRYSCMICKYFTNVKQNYNNHLLSKKHKIQKEKDQKTIDMENEHGKYICALCEKNYKSYSGMWNHRKKCKGKTSAPAAEKAPDDTKIKEILYELFNEFKVEIKNEITKILTEHNNAITNTTTNTTNSHNTTNNTNNYTMVFLNEKCKDAINFMDFIENIRVDLNTLLHIPTDGYVRFASRLLIDKLKKYPIDRRPLHCISDKNSNKTIHVRDENEWKDDKTQKQEVKQVLTKGVDKLDDNVANLHDKHLSSSKMYANITEEIERYNDLKTYSTKEQEQIINNIIPTIELKDRFLK